MVLGYAAQAQVNSNQQNGSKTGEWFNPACLFLCLFVSFLLLCDNFIYDILQVLQKYGLEPELHRQLIKQMFIKERELLRRTYHKLRN